MLIENDVNAKVNHIAIGNDTDVCILCAYEKAKDEKITLTMADKKLRGVYNHKLMLKLPISGFRATICMDHIIKIADEYRDKTIKEFFGNG